MYKLYISLLCMICFLTIAFPLSADVIKYNFDDIEVIYAGEYTAVPVFPGEEGWFTELAGGADRPLQILYGIVLLKTIYTDGEETRESVTTEEFIKISGPNGSQRFLLNSGSYEWWDGESAPKLKCARSFFWSAKQLEGNTVVKDFSPPIHSVTLKRTFDEKQNLTGVELYFSSDGEQASQDFWWDTNPGKNVYVVDLAASIQYGNPAETGEEK